MEIGLHPNRTAIVIEAAASGTVSMLRVLKLSTPILNRKGTQTFNTLAPPSKLSDISTLGVMANISEMEPFGIMAVWHHQNYYISSFKRSIFLMKNYYAK